MKLEERAKKLQKIADDVAIVQQGVMYAEINEFFAKQLQAEGYAGMEYKPYGPTIEITITVARPGNLLDNQKLRVKQLISLIQMRFGLPSGHIALYIDQVKNRGLTPLVQAEAIREKLATGIPVRRAVSGALRTIMESGAAGAQVIISGKIRGQRAKSYKVSSGILLHSGSSKNDYVRKGMTSILLKQGVLGIKVAITLQYDPTGKIGTTVLHPKKVVVFSQEELDEQNKQRQKSQAPPRKQ